MEAYFYVLKSTQCHKPYHSLFGVILNRGMLQSETSIGDAFWLDFPHQFRVSRKQRAHPGASATPLMIPNGSGSRRSREWKNTGESSINGGFLKCGYPPNGWFVMENPIKMDDLGVPLFQETTVYGCCSMERCNITGRWHQLW